MARTTLEVRFQGIDELTPQLRQVQQEVGRTADEVADSLDEVGESSAGVSENMGDMNEAMDETADESRHLGGVIDRFLSDPINAAGAAAAGVGAALVTLTSTSRDFGTAIERAGFITGIAAGELQDLAFALSNDALIPAQDVARAFETLAQMGITTREELSAITLAADRLSAATGIDVVQAIRSMAAQADASNSSLVEVSENMNVLGAVGVFAGQEGVAQMQRQLPQLKSALDATGLSVEDYAAVLIAVTQGGGDLTRMLRRVRTEIQEAGREGLNASQTFQLLEDELGLSHDAVEELTRVVENGSEAMDEFDRINSQHEGTFDEMKNSLNNVRLEVGGFLRPLNDAGQAMTTLGFAALFLNNVIPWVRAGLASIIPIIRGITLSIRTLLITTGIGILLVVLSLLFEAWQGNWFGIRDVTADVVGSLIRFFRDLWGGIQRFVGAIVDFVRDHWDEMASIFAFFTGGPLAALTAAFSTNAFGIWDIVSNLVDSIRGFFRDLAGDALDWGANILEALWEGIQSRISGLIDRIKGIGNTVKDAIADGLGALWPGSPSEAGIAVGEGLVSGIAVGTRGRAADVPILDMRRALPSGGGQSITINLNGATIRDERDVDRLARAVARELRSASMGVG